MAAPRRLIVLLAAAAVLYGCGSGGQQHATIRPSKAHSRAPTPATTTAPGHTLHRTPRPESTAPPKAAFPASLPRSLPTSVTIPAIGVAARTIRLGLNSDGSVQTPPSSPEQITGWFERSPTPGELGAPSIILGHIDSHRYGPEVFYRLHELRPGAVIEIGRQDGTTAKFAVQKVEQYPKAQFPKVKVYGGGSALDRPGLRLITCGGAFDAAKRSYLDNIVAYAALIS
ncbi:MAG TPA: class F sortase [Mycobacteriales bacterium]|nr:class F sortase [Mycobacteriales bacterium]